jgi:NIMA (never in mitosis gene a)-related kinase
VAEADEKKIFLAKVSLLDIIRYRAYKHRTCCHLFNDLVSLKCSLIIPNDEAENDCFDFLVREKACFAKSSDGTILAASSSILFHDSEFAKRFLDSNVNILPEKYDGFIVGFKSVTGLLLLENSNVVLEDLDIAHPFTKIVAYICLENRMTVYARSRLTINFFLKELVLTRKLQYDANYSCPTPQWCEFPPTHYALRVHKALLALCREIMICMRSLSHQEVDESVDFSAYTAIEFVLSFLLRTSFWYEEMNQLRYEVMEFILYWVDWHANNYARHAFLAYSIPWTIKALETLISFHTCITCNVTIYPEEQIARLKRYFEIFSSKPPPEEFAKNHSIIIDHFLFLFGYIPSDAVCKKNIPEISLNHYFHSDRYQFNGIIGTGSQGTVLKCYDHFEATFVALKMVPISDECKLLAEIKLFLSLNHANIVRHLDIFKEKNNCFMVMEYCEGKSLNRFKRSWDSAEQKEFRIRIIGRQILLGLSYLHAHHVIHHDIKPENIFVDGKGVVKIGDFGIALINHKHKESNPLSGTVAYMAPECIDNENCKSSSDIWSFGCMLLFLLTGFKPWHHVADSTSIILKLTQTDEVPLIFDCLNCSNDLLNIIKSMLRRNPDERPTAVELLRSESFSGLAETLF